MRTQIVRGAALLALGVVMLGSTSAIAASKSRTRATGSPEWMLQGSRIIGCCCASPCPCRINKPPLERHGCDATTAIHIEKGYLGNTRMDGVTFAIIGRGFGENVEGNWGYVYVSDKATPAQVKALQAMLEADVKSFGAKAPHLAGKFLGMRQVPMTYTVSADKRMYSCVIPGILDFRTQAIILPGRTKPAVSTGIFDAFGDRFVHAECVAHTYDDPKIGQSWDLTGRQCNQADFRIDSNRVAKEKIGWGCWSAHASLGSKDKYQEQIIEEGHAKKK